MGTKGRARGKRKRSIDCRPSGMDENEATSSVNAACACSGFEEGMATGEEARARLSSPGRKEQKKDENTDVQEGRKRRKMETGSEEEIETSTETKNHPPPTSKGGKLNKPKYSPFKQFGRRRRRKRRNTVPETSQPGKPNEMDSSDEDLPASEMSTPKELEKGNVVWAKLRQYPHWPAVIVRTEKKESKKQVSVNFFAYDGPSHTFKNPGKNLKPYNKENREIVHGCYEQLREKEYLRKALENAVQFADAFIRKQVLRTSEGSREQQEEFEHINDFCSPKDYKPRPQTSPALSYKLPPIGQPDFSNCKESEESSCDEEEEGKPEEEEPERDRLTELEKNIIDPDISDEYKDEDFVINFVKGLKDELYKVFRREVPSERHNDFHSPRPSVRNLLKHQTGFGPIQSTNLHDKIVEELHSILTGFNPQENFNHNNYVFEVMLPEAIIRLIGMIDKVSTQAAEETYISHITGQT